MAMITLGGGCFWCVDAALRQLKGVNHSVCGYADGIIENPTYQQVCTGTTDHAEVVQLTFDADIIDLQTLLQLFFTIHDPTTLNRQGADAGTQYRSTILCHDNEQLLLVKKFIAQLDASGVWEDPIVTEVKLLETFYEAEQYHQNYFQLNPSNSYCQAVISPKLVKLKNNYPSYLLSLGK